MLPNRCTDVALGAQSAEIVVVDGHDRILPVLDEKAAAYATAQLEAKGVQSGVHYPRPVHLQPAYAHLALSAGSLPESERAAATEISLPMVPELTDAQADQVVDAVLAVARELS